MFKKTVGTFVGTLHQNAAYLWHFCFLHIDLFRFSPLVSTINFRM